MKITRKQLRRIVKEQTQYTGNEHLIIDTAQQQIEDIINGLYDEGIGNPELIALLQSVIKDIETGFVGEPS